MINNVNHYMYIIIYIINVNNWYHISIEWINGKSFIHVQIKYNYIKINTIKIKIKNSSMFINIQKLIIFECSPCFEKF